MIDLVSKSLISRFTAEVPDWEGVYVKDADKAIIQKLKEMGNLVRRGEVSTSQGQQERERERERRGQHGQERRS